MKRHTSGSEFDVSKLDSLPRVDIVYSHSNADRVPIDAFVKAGAKGIIMAGTGDGSVHEWEEPGIVDATKKGVIEREIRRNELTVVPFFKGIELQIAAEANPAARKLIPELRSLFEEYGKG